MIEDGWMDQAIGLLEQNRHYQDILSREQGRPVDFFKYELQILNHSKVLSKDERCQRFYDLVANRNYTEGVDEDNSEIKGEIVGAGLLWARARFEVRHGEQVPVNQWVKLTVEVFTRLRQSQALDVETINVNFNEASFDFKAAGGSLSKDSGPLTIEQDIYLDDQLVYRKLDGRQLVLTNVSLKLKEKPIKLVMQPYLIARDKIQARMEKRGAGLKLPVALNIKDMPPMLDFKLEYDNGVQVGPKSIREALIGNTERVKITISKKKKVNLKSLTLEVTQVNDIGCDEEVQRTDSDLMGVVHASGHGHQRRRTVR